MQFLFALMMLILFLILAACAPLSWLSPKGSQTLSSKAQNIPIVETMDAQQLSQLTKLKELTCIIGQNPHPVEKNIDACKNDIRSQAESLGATTLLMDPKKDLKIGKDLEPTFSGAMNCENCISLTAIAFKKKKVSSKHEAVQKKNKKAPTMDQICDEVVDCSLKKSKKIQSGKKTY